MATKKGQKVDVRPTLEEVKAQPGKYLYVTYIGTEGGGWGLPAPRPRFAGDHTEELFIVPFETKPIGDEWLENPRFIALYDKVRGIKVWRSDDFPEQIDLTIPEELDKQVSKYRQAIALTIATSPFEKDKESGENHFLDMINVRSMDVSESESVRYDHSDVLPFLKVLQFYEKRLLNRPEVMKAIEERLRDIIGEKPPLERVESY